MHTSNFEEALDLIVQKDTRYQRDAYQFVREALDHTQRMVDKAVKGEKSEPRQAPVSEEMVEEKVRHVSGQQLLEGIRAYALDQYGPMSVTVFAEWGVRTCEDFGELVFNMVENHLLAKTKKDSREDFRGGYNFEEAFCRPFLPDAKQPPLEPSKV
jgi:uncharacterized repeat protein (TIGR04138 family)